MRTSSILLTLVWVGLHAPIAAGQTAATIAITNVTIVRVEDGSRLPDQTVLVLGNRIVAVGASKSISVPARARRVDGRGAFLIPGLWDMHVHAIRTSSPTIQGSIFGLFIANGVTGVRDMGGYLDTLIAVEALIARGEFGAVPRLMAAGPLLDGPKFRWSHPIAWHLESAADARTAVDSLKRAGVDFLKIYGSLSRDAYFAVTAEARRAGLSFAGHIPTGVSAAEASTAGQASFEHNDMWVSGGCVDDAATRVNTALTRWTREGYGAWFTERRAFHAARDAARCLKLQELFRKNGTRIVPTIVNEVKDHRVFMRPAFRYLDEEGKRACKATVASIEQGPDSLREGFYADFRAEVQELRQAGIAILAGTDVPNPCLTPGFSLHDELEELVLAGLTPREALAAATIGPAAFLGLSDSLGTIAPGMVADLVLLDADPLVKVGNTTRIRAVFANGRPFGRRELDAMLPRLTSP